ncbi:MAG: hypothetical protein HWE23_12385 [Rhodobacteraceae bacterium]|nr:hypothetical protein [Paracoccaceae bacterium]
MSVRPPKAFSQQAQDDPIAAALDQEILEEKVGTLTRLNKKLEKSLEAYAAKTECDEALRDKDLCMKLKAEAAEALWHVMIQRELCGMRSHQAFLNHMNVPREVRLIAGPVQKSVKSDT